MGSSEQTPMTLLSVLIVANKLEIFPTEIKDEITSQSFESVIITK